MLLCERHRKPFHIPTVAQEVFDVSGAGDTVIATFTLATNESWKDTEGNLQERTEWHNIVAWRKLAEICGEWLKKGKKVYIEGRIQTRTYDDKNTGQKRYITEIVADQMLMLDSAGGQGRGEATGNNRPSAPQQSEGPETGKAEESDLPF